MEKKATHEAANNVCVNVAATDPHVGGTRVFDDIPDTAVAEDVVRDSTSDNKAMQFDKPRAPLDLDNKLGTVPERAHGTIKMDVSQQTPTQVNADRDYAEFCEPLPSSPTYDRTQINTNDEPRTLNPDDTGAVDFGSLGEFARPSSQVSEDEGFENTRGEWRRPDDTSQLRANHASTPYKPPDLPPETPALPKNPFGSKNNSAVPFGGTQLFGQTQMLSSAAKIASPTSSRPSPSIFLNSISPNIMEASPLKNRANVSSPTDIRTSSPTRLHEVPATVLKNNTLSIVVEETPAPLRSQKDELIPESPTFKTARPSVSHQPMAHYEPMNESQERKKGSRDARNARPVLDSDFDEAFQKLDRKRRVERKRAQAAAEMDKVSFMRTQQRLSDEQPGKKRRKLGTEDTDAQGAKNEGQGQPLVKDSQKAITQSAEQPSEESTKATPGVAVESVDAQKELADAQPAPELSDEEMIPATSPVRSSSAIYQRDTAPSASEPELPVLRGSGTEQGQDAMDSSSLPPIRQVSQRTYSRRGRGTRTRLVVVSPAEETEQEPVEPAKEPVDRMEGSEDTAKKKNNALPSSYSEPPVPMGTRSRRTEQRTRTPRRSINVDRNVLTSSSLTNLSGTPVPSSKTTPGTQDSHSPDRRESVHLVSPEDSVRPLRRRAQNGLKSESPQPMTKAMRLSRRSLRLDSDSTDELCHSPSATALDRSTLSKSVRSFRTSLASTSRTRRLFDGMAFALSFSGSQAQRTKLETKISQAGGMILHEGFQELFEQWTVAHANSIQEDGSPPLRLTKAGLEHGFAAVIADSHSRKAKYMQALALGLPCLAPQWATACLKRGVIVDWAPYLLCAGASQVLGNAIRSRILVPYSALDAILPDTIEARDKLLHGEKLLIVMDHKKSRKETKQQYLFLALALSPSAVSRVTTAQLAGDAVRHAELSGSPFGWIYVDSSTATVEEVLAAAQESGKRRRKVASEPVGLGMRVLTDELMIQSLILGRMVELGEMDE
ncbi:DNA damage repair protein (Rad9), putative [Metarhizium acridum CQMa 102]|uniref:DNA damage repair protein (Rad9), putative n=1 Tax=Metarhizium acridum (strain CQMa 102) TaxID=655827 RepID=E9EDB4_METAQ|nr:DNA damage repair protein (Rad9), putative [Metarhizium acridum CQMa 102]EFY86054.1 DNA damage repair protein (Rad9), putative [Metarhizium acridum CQMa 102]